MGERGVDSVLLTVGCYSITEFLIVFCTVLFAEGLPGQVNGNRGIADKKATANDGIIGLFELEQKQVIGYEGMKGFASRSQKLTSSMFLLRRVLYQLKTVRPMKMFMGVTLIHKFTF